MPSVLLVDDEAPIREVCRRWLEPEGYDVLEAESAESALELLTSRTADAILCDVQMPPGRDGLWLIARVRERYPYAAMILATTVDSVPPVVSMQSGVVQYLLKPLQRAPLLEAVKTAVQWHVEAQARGPIRTPARDPIADWMKAGPHGRRAPLPPED